MLAALIFLFASSLQAGPKTSSAYEAAAKCLVRADARRSINLALTPPGSAIEKKKLAAFADLLQPCFEKVQIRQSDATIFSVLGAIAERTRPIVTWSSGYDQAQLDSLGQSERLLQETQDSSPDVAVISCATTRDPAAAERLLHAKPSSSGEKAALDNFMPTLSRCVETGSQVRLLPDRVRAVAARTRLRITYHEKAVRLR